MIQHNFFIHFQVPNEFSDKQNKTILEKQSLKKIAKQIAKKEAEKHLIEDAMIETEIMGYKTFVDPRMKDDELKMIDLSSLKNMR